MLSSVSSRQGNKKQYYIRDPHWTGDSDNWGCVVFDATFSCTSPQVNTQEAERLDMSSSIVAIKRTYIRLNSTSQPARDHAKTRTKQEIYGRLHTCCHVLATNNRKPILKKKNVLHFWHGVNIIVVKTTQNVVILDWKKHHAKLSPLSIIRGNLLTDTSTTRKG